MYWQNILTEFLQQRKDINQSVSASKSEKRPFRHRRFKIQRFLPWHGETYFTAREAQCMWMLLQGKTMKNIALELCLSPRTIEYYLKNLKSKVGCRTKYELIECMRGSDFVNTFNWAELTTAED